MNLLNILLVLATIVFCSMPFVFIVTAYLESNISERTRLIELQKTIEGK